MSWDDHGYGGMSGGIGIHSRHCTCEKCVIRPTQATPAPGAERSALREWIEKQKVTAERQRALSLNDAHFWKYWDGRVDAFIDTLSEMREALAAAPPAPDERDAIQERAYNNGFEHGKVAAGHASAERVRQLEAALQQIANSTCSCLSNEDPNWHGERCLKAIALRALPPSTGEKSQ